VVFIYRRTDLFSDLKTGFSLVNQEIGSKPDMLVDQQNSNVLPFCELLERCLDGGYLCL